MSRIKNASRGVWIAGVCIALIGVLSGATLTHTSFDETARTAARPAVKPSAQWLASARSALVQYLRRDPSPVAAIAGPSSNPTATSYNWSGYVDASTSKGLLSSVAGTWTTPSIKCTSEDSITSEWVGLDGWKDKTVEQDGTLDWCFEGQATYFTWYEMFPAGTIEVGTSLQPGDQITASVSRTAATTYRLSLTDHARPADSFTEAATCPATTCLDTSAEWIAERPDFQTTGFTPLADFGTWSVTDATVTEGTVVGTISSFHPVEVAMIDSTKSYLLSNPSSLFAKNSFSTVWENSY